MKKFIFLPLFFLCFISAALAAFDSARSALATVYHTLSLYETTNEKKGINYIDSMFVPIGWSADGKFAYIAEVINEAAGFGGMAVFKWVIQDMMNDKIVWDSGRGFEKELPKKLWNAKTTEILEWEYTNLMKKYQGKLNKYKIVINDQSKLEKFPLYYNNGEYRGFVSNIARGKKYGFDEEMIVKYNIGIKKGQTQKTIGQFNDEYLLDTQVVGYFKSPYEPRIAVAICNVSRGWEGLPHPVSIKFTGCHLKKGFRIKINR